MCVIRLNDMLIVTVRVKQSDGSYTWQNQIQSSGKKKKKKTSTGHLNGIQAKGCNLNLISLNIFYVLTIDNF